MIGSFSKYFKNNKNYQTLLKDFSISKKRGFLEFLTEDIHLPRSFNKYNELYENNYELVHSGKMTENILKLEFDESELAKITDHKVLTKIFSITSVLTNSFLINVQNKDDVILPKELAVPLYTSSKFLKIMPVFCLWSCLHGVKQIGDPNEPYSFKNTKMRFSFTDTLAEDSFLKINFLVSLKMNKLFEKIFTLNEIIYKHFDENTFKLETNFSTSELELIKMELNEMNEMVQDINKYSIELFSYIVDANHFYNELRKYLQGYSHFKNGVYFEGVNKSFFSPGASAGQDPYNLLLKGLLGVRYSHTGKSDIIEYEDNFRQSIRQDHLRFIQNMENYSLIKYLADCKEVKDDYNKVITSFRNFYLIHKSYVTKYIEKPANLNNEKSSGTGGSSIQITKAVPEFYRINSEKKSNYKFGESEMNIVVHPNKSYIDISIRINGKINEDLTLLSKLDIESKIENIIDKEKIDRNHRILIIFCVTKDNNNLISNMISDGVSTLISVYCLKHIYTKYNVIAIFSENKVPKNLIDETKSFLLQPEISKIMHSSVLVYKDSEYKMLSELEGENYTLVTGGARGIGEGACISIAEEGRNLIITGRKGNKKGIELAKELMENFKIKAIFYELDMESIESIQELVEKIKAGNIKLESVIHNAAVGTATSVEQSKTSEDPNEYMIKVNSLGPLQLQEELERGKVLTDGCRIFIISSVGGGTRPFKEFNPIDVTSKSVLNTFANFLSTKDNLSVATIFPGATNTDMFKKSTLSKIKDKEILDEFISKFPKKSLINPMDLGKILSFFSRKEISKYSNGFKIQASCGLNLDFKDLPEIKTNEVLSLPEAHFMCVQDPYNKLHNHNGKISFGASQNYLIFDEIKKFLPEFLEDKDLAYSKFSGQDNFLELLINSDFGKEQTLPFMSLECCLDMLCHKFKNISVKGTPGAYFKNIVEHSNVNIVDENRSECDLIFYPQEDEIKTLAEIENMKKFTVLVINDANEIISTKNKNIIYCYEKTFSENVYCGLIQTLNTELIKDFLSLHVFYLVSNVIQAAAVKKIPLSPQHELKGSLVKMFLLEKLSVEKEFIYLTNKCSIALDSIAKSIFKPSDEISLSTPCYPGFIDDLTRNGTRLRFVPDAPGLTLFKKVTRAKEDGANGFVICNPENPLGTVYSKEEITRLCEWASSNKNFYLIFDEIYANCVYEENKKFYSAIDFATKFENIIVVRGFAKDFGLSGLNLGVVISCNKTIKSNFEKWNRIQVPLPAVLNVFDTMLKKTSYGTLIFDVNKSNLKKTMNFTCDLLDKYGIKYLKPTAGLFIMIDLREYLSKHKEENEVSLCNKIFRQCGVSVSPGSIFKYKEPGWFRICNMYDVSTLTEGIIRLIKFLGN